MIKNRHLIVLAALVGREQRTAVLLGQVGNGLNKCDSSHKFKNYYTWKLRIPIEVLLRNKLIDKDIKQDIWAIGYRRAREDYAGSNGIRLQ
jgi:hypothetical protein